MSQQQQQQQKPKKQIFCETCGVQIKFSKFHRTDSGGWVPLLLDGIPHDCPNKPYNQKQRQQQQLSQSQPQSAPNNQLTMGNKEMILEAQIASLTQTIDELKADMRVNFQHIHFQHLFSFGVIVLLEYIFDTLP